VDGVIACRPQLLAPITGVLNVVVVVVCPNAVLAQQ